MLKVGKIQNRTSYSLITNLLSSLDPSLSITAIGPFASSTLDMIASPRQLAYAPTPYSYTPNTSLSATINLDQVHPYLIIPPPASCIASLIPQITSAHAKSIRSPKKEVKLSETAAERDLQDSLAEIYSIIITLDGLEKAYIKDSIPETEYTELCNRLLKQYKSNLNDENVARAFVDLETFKREWDVSQVLA